jgi:hypothetical protein
MKKKIIVIGIIGMFLLTGLTTVSSTQVENNNLTTSSTDSPSENGNDYPLLCSIAKIGISLYNKDYGYHNNNKEILAALYLILSQPPLEYTWILMDSKGIESMKDLDCHCA